MSGYCDDCGNTICVCREGVLLSTSIDDGQVIRPGDTVIISTHAQTGRYEAERIRNEIADRLPGVTVLVLDRMSVTGIYRPDEP